MQEALPLLYRAHVRHVKQAYHVFARTCLPLSYRPSLSALSIMGDLPGLEPGAFSPNAPERKYSTC